MLKLFSMFSGYGGAEFALKKAGIDFEVVGYSEIDKFAIQCYNQNHAIYYSECHKNGEPHDKAYQVKNYGDCTKIVPEELPDFDLLTAGFPCQDVSIAGSRDLSKGRTMLVNDIFRIVKVKKPKYVVLENVKGLLSASKGRLFNNIRYTLSKLGYGMPLYKVLNTKDYGIPQNRERIFIICKLGGFEFMEFQFPKKEKLKLFLKDILESEVDEKYYLKQEQVNKLLKNIKQDNNWNTNPSGNGMNGDVYFGDVSPTITTNKGEGHKIIQVNNPVHSNNRVYDSEGCSPTLRDMSKGGNRQPFIKVKNATNKGYQEARIGDGINLEQPDSKTRRGRVQLQSSPTLQTNDQRGVVVKKPLILDLYNKKIKDDGVCITLTEPHHNNLRIHDTISIRKLTPKECFRLMGFLDDNINLEGLSNTQKYRLAGNGWDINLVSKIFKNLEENIQSFFK